MNILIPEWRPTRLHSSIIRASSPRLVCSNPNEYRLHRIQTMIVKYNNEKWKSTMCWHALEGRACPYRDKCAYAHSDEELRQGNRAEPKRYLIAEDEEKKNRRNEHMRKSERREFFFACRWEYPPSYRTRP